MVGNAVKNHLMCADDIVVFIPSSAGLQKQLNVCNVGSQLYDVKFNSSKSVILIFFTEKDKFRPFPNFKLSGILSASQMK